MSKNASSPEASTMIYWKDLPAGAKVVDNGPSFSFGAKTVYWLGEEASSAVSHLQGISTKPAPAALKTGGKAMDADVLEAVRECQVTEDKVYLPKRDLGKELYGKVKAVLVGYGGVWKGGKTQAFVFSRDPREALKEAMGSGKAVNVRKVLQAFFTPEDLAQRVVAAACVEQGQSVLEPSAGEGSLVKVLLGEGLGLDIVAVEIDGHHCGLLRSKFGGSDGFHLIEDDFFAANLSPTFDRVVMNPPFAKGAAAAHVMHAWSLLKPGGKLVAIMPAGVSNGTTKALLKLQKEVLAYGTVEDIPAGAFKEAGTGIATSLLVATKPG